MANRCATCNGPMPANSGMGRPRRHCAECRPSHRTGKVAQLPDLPTPDTGEGVRSATFAELSAAGRADTAKGRACLLLAARLDEQVDTAAGMAAAVKQLREALDDALAGAAVAADPVDELQRRRRAKFA